MIKLTSFKKLFTGSMIVLMFTLVFSTLFFFSTLNAEDSKPASHVNMAWEEFKKFLKLDTPEIQLTWDEFKKLVAQTGEDRDVRYNLKDGMVIMTRQQFKTLLNKMKPPVDLQHKLNKDYLITKASYVGKMDKESTTFRVTFQIEIPKKEKNHYIKIPLLPHTVALQEIKLDNQKAIVMNTNQWHELVTNKSGHHKVTVKFSVKSSIDKGARAFSFNVPQTAITLLKVDIPIKKVKAIIPQAKQSTVSYLKGRTIVSSVLSPSTMLELKLHRTIAQKKKQGPAKLYAETLNLFSLDDEALRVQTRLKLNILQNTMSVINLNIPEGFSVLYVQDKNGASHRDWHTRTKDGRATLSIMLGNEEEGMIIYNVVSEKIFSKEKSEIAFEGFQVSGAVRETGYIGAEKKSTAEAELLTVENSDRIDIQELPLELVSMSAKPLIFGIRYLHHPYKLNLKITKHKEIATVNTVIDNASVMSVVMEEGKVVTRVVYSIRNTWKQFLEVKLPKDSEMWSLTVAGKRELPSKNKDGKFLVPLIRSKMDGEKIRPFEIEMLYYTKTNKYGIAGNRKLPFPTADVLISQVLWSCYLPVEHSFLRFGGNLEKEKIAAGIRPLLGQKRVFTYKDINGYNEVLSSIQKRKSGSYSKRNKNLRRVLQSEFRSQSQNTDQLFANQLKQEISFAQNVKSIQEQSVISANNTGMALLQIEVPTTGQIYRFAKNLVESEDLYIETTFVRNWVRSSVLLLVVGALLYLLFLNRRRFNSLRLALSQKIAALKPQLAYLKTPRGGRILLAIAAICFLFLSKVLFTVVMLLFLIAWIRPEWVFRNKADRKKTDKTEKAKTKKVKSEKE